MTGFISLHGVFSRLTFALLEDSGYDKCTDIHSYAQLCFLRWYQVDYSNADQLVWGRNSGCGLAAGSCGGFINSQLQE